MYARCKQQQLLQCRTNTLGCISVVRCFAGSTEDLYSVLAVPVTASQQEIKAAYRKLVQDLHPDKHAHRQDQVDVTAAFLRCKVAYEVLSDTERRSEYDETLQATGSTAMQQGSSAEHSQPWSPYNTWMDAYGGNNANASTSYSYSDTAAQATAAASADDYYSNLLAYGATAAAAAAGASSSGLSSHPLNPMWDENHPALGTDQQPSATVRAALLDQHGLALEQFGSMQEALEALAEIEQQQAVLGLAEGDYDNDYQAWPGSN